MASCDGNCGNTCSVSGSAGCDGCSDSCSGYCGDSCTGCGGACSYSCTYGCFDTCLDTCSDTCLDTCLDTCTGTCVGNCYGGCVGNCYGGCTGNCFEACSESCYDACKDSCFDSCNDKCYSSCSTICRGYCALNAQNYCDTAQIFIKNLSSEEVQNPVGRPEFNWTNENKQGETIKITHNDWNTLKSYIQQATLYCGGITPSKPQVNQNDLITEEQYNDLANGLGLINVEKNKTIISADIINLLQSKYNTLTIIEGTPTGESNGKPLMGDGCCQSGQTCIGAELDETLGKITDCQGQQIETTTPNPSSPDASPAK